MLACVSCATYLSGRAPQNPLPPFNLAYKTLFSLFLWKSTTTYYLVSMKSESNFVFPNCIQIPYSYYRKNTTIPRKETIKGFITIGCNSIILKVPLHKLWCLSYVSIWNNKGTKVITNPRFLAHWTNDGKYNWKIVLIYWPTLFIQYLLDILQFQISQCWAKQIGTHCKFQ